MCFSASASFSASAILAVAGMISLKKVEKPSQLPFAFVPVLFSLQQFTEGLVWIALKDHEHWKNIPIYLFLFIAQVLWPFWVPLSVWLIEENEHRKKELQVFLFSGSILSLYLGFCLFFYKADAIITPYHIHYELYFPQNITTLVGIIYFLSTIIAPFLSTHKRMKFLGTFNLLSFIVSEIFFKDYLVSVWCFFSALISWEVYLVMKNMKK